MNDKMYIPSYKEKKEQQFIDFLEKEVNKIYNKNILNIFTVLDTLSVYKSEWVYREYYESRRINLVFLPIC